MPLRKRIHTTVSDQFPVHGAKKASQIRRAIAAEAARIMSTQSLFNYRTAKQKAAERLGFETLEAADGQEAVEVFREHAESITCVLLDLTMPRMDGGEACLEIQRIRRDVAIVLSSGYEETELFERFDGYDMAGFIQKPYKLAKLREILKSAHPAEP